MKRGWHCSSEAIPESLLTAVVDSPVPIDAVRRRLHLSDAELAEGLDAVERAGDWLCSKAWLTATRAAARASLAAREAELDPGLPPTALLGDAPWAGDVAKLLELEAREGKLYVPGHGPRTDGRGDELERRLDEAGLEPLTIDDAGLARQLERDGRLVRLGPTLVISPAAYEHYKALVVAECEQAGTDLARALPRPCGGAEATRAVAARAIRRRPGHAAGRRRAPPAPSGSTRVGCRSRGAAGARWPSRPSKLVRSCNPRLGRFDSCAAP